MKIILLLIITILSVAVSAQNHSFNVHEISLPSEISFYDNQFSGLYIHNGKLFLMSECRLQDKAEGKLYSIHLSDLKKQLIDTSYVLPYQKLHLYGIEKLRDKISALGQNYEGLEAIVFHGDDAYLSVETDTPSPDCFLLKGKLEDTAVMINTDFLLKIPKPVNLDNSHIYNAGFEAITEINNQIFALFEYNYFPLSNYVYKLCSNLIDTSQREQKIAINKLPFRVTDITRVDENHFTAINYFFKGGGKDAIYRTSDNEPENKGLIYDSTGYHSYCRLIEIEYSGNSFSWKPLWEFPKQYSEYNWEGISAFNNGYFIINDKYTPKRPYKSTLLYLQ